MMSIKVNEKVLAKTVQRCKERGIIIPTFAQQKDPRHVPAEIRHRLSKVGLWDINPVNLFRITWKNEPRSKGGTYGGVNFLEIPREITGIKARVIGIVGKYFPTGAHKVGAAFGCLVPRLVTGQFDPSQQKAVWPSTGNYCRGGAFDCALLGCDAIAILPAEMSKERFTWLKSIKTSEIIATPGCESNVKEIYDKCHELTRDRGDKIVIFNQFEEFGNANWHYHVTGSAIREVFEQVRGKRGRLAGYCSTTGSAGTINAGDYLRTLAPDIKVAAGEAKQCPTLLNNGFGGHRIEGIGDKHVPWIHNVRNTDMVIAIDDADTMSLLRLFNEPDGHKYLASRKVPQSVINQLSLLGISGIANMLMSIKMAKYYEMDEDDIIFTVFTDSAELYGSRVKELAKAHGDYSRQQAVHDFAQFLSGAGTGDMKELGYYDRKALHHLKYYTWVEQQGKTYEEINELWKPSFWTDKFVHMDELDELIIDFNKRTGLLK
ncbi:MAG TPA: pyridoxal-phosphate dependent enzyme [bacterium]|nr:pyridoxal-phosphate dependent enzyme [bacterium]